MRQIVCDTGPLLHLWEIGRLSLLQAAGSTFIPPAVERELRRIAAPWDSLPWVKTVRLDPSLAEEARQWTEAGLLDAGEAQALALARQLKVDWLLTDDTAARLVAKSQGYEVHGSLGVVLWAAATDLLAEAEARDLLDRLARSSLWISPRVLKAATTALEQIFRPEDPGG